MSANDGHICRDECADDEPVVIGRWLRFLTPDHDGLTWVPVDRITRIESYSTSLDVAHLPPERGTPDEVEHDCTAAWDRVLTPTPWVTAAEIARAASGGAS